MARAAREMQELAQRMPKGMFYGMAVQVSSFCIVVIYDLTCMYISKLTPDVSLNDVM